MENVFKALAIVGLILLIPAYIYASVWVLHWAVGLFYPISMWQAFGIIVLLNLFGTTTVRASR